MAAHEKTHSKKLGNSKQRRKAKSGKKVPKPDKPKRTYNKKKGPGEKTKRIRKEPKCNAKKRAKDKKENAKYNQFNISSITEDMIQNMKSYLDQEFRRKQEQKQGQSGMVRSARETQSNDFSSYFKKFNYTFGDMESKKKD